MGKKKDFSWLSCFGGCAKVEDAPSPKPSPERQPAKQIAKQSSFTRLSYSDLSTATTQEGLSSLSSSLLGSNLHIFTMAELKVVTQSFSTSNLLGEGGFGPVYKGFIDDKLRPGLKAQTVAVKQLDLEGMQGHKEWLTEVILLGQLKHPHLVKLIGYCYEEDHRMLVYEYMARGSLENHLFKKYFVSLPWDKRIKIAVGAAKGLAFLHGVDQPVIYRDFKASNILLDSEYKAKLSDFGLAKDGPQGEDTHVSTRVMGTHGYAAPEYIMTGHLTAKSDVYSFGVVLLELLTGRRSVDKSRSSREQNLVDWARPCLNDPRRLGRIIDPGLDGQYSTKGAQKAAALAYLCLSHLPKSRPRMSEVVEILEPLLEYNDIPVGTFVFTVDQGNDKAENRATKPPKEDSAEERAAAATPPGETEHRQHHHHRHHHHKKPTEKPQGHRHRHHRSSRPVNYTDTALYSKSPRQQQQCGGDRGA